MKKLMIGLMISGAALMAQGTAPAASTNAASSNASSTNATAAPTTKVKKHHKRVKNAAPATNATPNASSTATPAPAAK